MNIKTLADWPAGLFVTQYLRVGDKVDNDMYMYFLNIAGPHAFGYTYLQVGGACDLVKAEDGTLKNTFLTFEKDVANDCWVFLGECFTQEKVNRNPELEPCNEVARLIDAAKSRVVESSDRTAVKEGVLLD